jgi:hypothetical protein
MMGGDLTATSKPRKFSVGAQRKHALICLVLRPDDLGAPDPSNQSCARRKTSPDRFAKPMLTGVNRQLVRHWAMRVGINGST